MRRADQRLLVGAGIAMLVAFIAINLRSPRLGSPAHLALVGIAAAGYVTALVVLFVRRQLPGGTLLVVCLLFAAAFRVPLLLTEPGDDALRYVWDARVHHAGYDPYVAIPADPALAQLHTAETRRINNAHLPTPYPPGAQLFFQFTRRFTERAHGFKIALALCDAALVFVLWRWLEASKRALGWLIVYAWNPLVILVTAGEGHLDVLGALWLMTSILMLTNGRRLLSASCLSMAIAVKPLPIVLLPLYWRRVSRWDAIAAGALLATLYAPYAKGWQLPVGSLGTFIDEFRFNQSAFALTGAALGARAGVLVAVVAGLAVAVALRRRTGVATPGAWAWPMATTLIFSPVIYQWYLVWLAPFFASRTTLPLVVWSLSILSTYAVWHRAVLGHPWVVPLWIVIPEFGVVLLAGAWVGLTARRRLAHDVV